MEHAEDIAEIAAAHQGAPGALMPILVDVNRRFGFIPAAAEPVLAEALNISRADVAGVIAFYSDFRKRPPGKTVVQICRAEACQAAGGRALAADAEATLGCGFGETTADCAATLEEIYCFGNCALAPAFAVNGRLYGRGSTAALARALEAAS